MPGGARFVTLGRELGLLTQVSVAIDGSKFKAVNNRDKNFTRAKMERRLAQIGRARVSTLSRGRPNDLAVELLDDLALSALRRAQPLPTTGFVARNALAGCRHIRRFWGISENIDSKCASTAKFDSKSRL